MSKIRRTRQQCRRPLEPFNNNITNVLHNYDNMDFSLCGWETPGWNGCTEVFCTEGTRPQRLKLPLPGKRQSKSQCRKTTTSSNGSHPELSTSRSIVKNTVFKNTHLPEVGSLTSRSHSQKPKELLVQKHLTLAQFLQELIGKNRIGRLPRSCTFKLRLES